LRRFELLLGDCLVVYHIYIMQASYGAAAGGCLLRGRLAGTLLIAPAGTQ
jgi:hypothetical protein